LYTWKIYQWLSHLIDIRIENQKSEINPQLKLYLSSGRFKLVTQGAVYSFEDKYTNFLDCFHTIREDLKNVSSVLVLGLGMGSIPQMLRQIFKSKALITAVELDEVIIQMYKKYAREEFQNGINIIQSNAIDFVKNSNQKFDLICMDVFLDSKVPSEFLTIEFSEGLKNLLNPNGIVIFNRLAEDKRDIQQNEEFDKRVFSKVFIAPSILKLDANWMFIGK